MLTLSKVQTLLNGNVDKDSRVLLTDAESILRCYDADTMEFMRKRTIDEINRLNASLYPHEHQEEITKANYQLTVLDLILNHNEEGDSII